MVRIKAKTKFNPRNKLFLYKSYTFHFSLCANLSCFSVRYYFNKIHIFKEPKNALKYLCYQVKRLDNNLVFI